MEAYITVTLTPTFIKITIILMYFVFLQGPTSRMCSHHYSNTRGNLLMILDYLILG